MSQLNYPHIAQMAFNTPLLASSQLVEMVTQYLYPRITGRTGEQSNLTAKGVGEVQLGNPEVDGSMAIISVHGILIPRRGTLTNACEEIMSFELLRNQIAACMANEQIKEIVLDINSGGGTAQAAFECAEYIYQAQKTKPIRAVINYNAYSAAYLIAAACTEIQLSSTAGVGSIGVYQKRLDLTAHYEQEGISIHTFFRGSKKVLFHPDIKMTEEEMQHTETEIEETYQQFVSAVAKYRGLTNAEVEATEADTFQGAKAIKLKLADTLTTDPQMAINNIAKRLIQKTPEKKMNSVALQSAALKHQFQH
ncbi:S49 family peptidase [Pseudoalteromonas rhizosphaerae]|uniref:S49 family peptidase n=1 Tax=Pseudoalteromonas rhizosphaerae TaxID=2518973 RepID=UPI001230430D|nr:S49 family peptidase [Pseudoalteromonas rhizosphaerae]